MDDQNQLPPPVDITRLKSILSGAKAVMQKVNSNNFSTGNIDPRALTEDGVRELQSEGVTRQTTSSPVQYTNETVMNSKLPDAIKQAMINNPIPQLTGLNHSFTLDDVIDHEQFEKPLPRPKIQQNNTRPRINESTNNSDLITISKSQLNELINENLLNFFAKSYNKMLTEETVKKTITTLIKEGKIIPKKKI